MGRFQQNLMYAVILVIIFAVCVYFLLQIMKLKQKEFIYLNTVLNYHQLILVKLEFIIYNTRVIHKEILVKSEPRLMSVMKKIFKKLCDKNLKEAIKLAAQHGAHEIKYICLYPEGQINELSSVQLRGYAFRD